MSQEQALLERPGEETSEAVYSNFDHALAIKVAEQLEAQPGGLFAQHAAWNFCGYVWILPGGQWVDQVWRYGTPVEDITGDSIEAVIEAVNDRYGTD